MIKDKNLIAFMKGMRIDMLELEENTRLLQVLKEKIRELGESL